MRGPKQLACALAACVPVVGMVMAFGPAAGASTVSTTPSAATVTRSAAAEQTAKSILEQYLSQHRSLLQVPSKHFAVRSVKNAAVTSTSTNWSGYVNSGTGFTQVAGSWTEPNVSCQGLGFSLVGLWVGIDGDGSDSVEQDGTMTECLFGLAFHFSWWEMYPTNSVQITGWSVSAGDHITASVKRSGTSYTLDVTDSTHTSDSFSTTQTCSDCSNSSAEWIAEAPSTLGGIASLADYGTWNVTGASVAAGSTSGGITAFSDDAITMVSSSGTTESVPGALNSAGTAFSTTWKSS